MEKLQEDKISEAVEEKTTKMKIKKYNVHGKITAGDKEGEAEISYYECDAIKCRKIIIGH